MDKPNSPWAAIFLPCAALILTDIFSSKIPILSIADIPITAGLTYCFYLFFSGISPKLDDALIFFGNKKYLLGCVIFLFAELGASGAAGLSFFAYLLGLGSGSCIFMFAAAAITAVLSVIQRIYFCHPEKGVKNSFKSLPPIIKKLPVQSIIFLVIIIAVTLKKSSFPIVLRPLLTDIPESAFIAYIIQKNPINSNERN